MRLLWVANWAGGGSGGDFLFNPLHFHVPPLKKNSSGLVWHLARALGTGEAVAIPPLPPCQVVPSFIVFCDPVDQQHVDWLPKRSTCQHRLLHTAPLPLAAVVQVLNESEAWEGCKGAGGEVAFDAASFPARRGEAAHLRRSRLLAHLFFPSARSRARACTLL